MTQALLLEPDFLEPLSSGQRKQAEVVAAAWMGFLPGMELASSAAAAAPEQPQLGLLAALVALTGQTPEARAEAAAQLKAVAGGLQSLDRWGQGLLEAAQLWYRGELGWALRRLEQLLLEAPQAVFPLKVAEWLCYLRGQESHGPRLLELASWCRQHHPEHPDVLAIEAFALELCGCLPEAERCAHEAIEQRSLNPWADHALLHSLQRRGALDQALQWAEERYGSWEAAAPPMALHNHWHRSLLWLEAAEDGLAWRQWLAVATVSPPQGTGEALDWIALACRLELAGPERWPELLNPIWRQLADGIADRCHQPEAPLIAVHYAWCLARAEHVADQAEALAALRHGVAVQAQRAGCAEAGWCWQPAGVELVEAAIALARGQHRQALDRLEFLQGWFALAGGSDAQALLLHQMLLVAAQRCGRDELADQIAARLRADRPSLTPLDRIWISRC
ncbi:hypothetical protein [Vulcanococcus sp.]|uniref:hypothetical protein n=1 Tax=Vulcanococcus sp. TaxID=2856995 RepID=UPI003F6A2C34